MKTRHFITTIVLSCMCSFTFIRAQQNNELKVLDLKVNFYRNYPNDYTDSVNQNYVTDFIYASKIGFLINQPPLADSVVVLLGTARGQDDLFHDNYAIISTDTANYIRVRETNVLIQNHSVNFNLILTENIILNSSHATLFVFDKNGVRSDSLYYKIK